MPLRLEPLLARHETRGTPGVHDRAALRHIHTPWSKAARN